MSFLQTLTTPKIIQKCCNTLQKSSDYVVMYKKIYGINSGSFPTQKKNTSIGPTNGIIIESTKIKK